MDIISYSIASKAAKQEQYTRNDVLGIGVEGTHPHVKARIDNLEKAIQGVVAQADKLIVNDAINIMKAHAKLNAVAKSMKYKMYNMIFDDLLDLSGIDTTKSIGYVHDSINGWIRASGSNAYIVITTTEFADVPPEKAILTVEERQVTFGLQMDGINDHAEIPHASQYNFTDKFTIEFLMQTTWKPPADSSMIIWKGYLSGWWTEYRPDGTLDFYMNVNGSNIYARIPGGIVNDGKLHRISLVYDGSNMIAYVDGVEKGRTTVSGNISSNTQPIGIGKPNTSSSWGSRRYQGILDDIRLWNIPRTATDIQANMFIELSGKEAGLVGYWPMNEGSGSTLIDMTSYKNTATIYGEATWIMNGSVETKTLKGIYSISRDDGVTWEFITPETLFYFNDNISPKDNRIRLKAELPADIQLLNYALTWA